MTRTETIRALNEVIIHLRALNAFLARMLATPHVAAQPEREDR